MKSLTIFLALTFSVMFSSSSYAGWKKVGKKTQHATYYVDFEKIRKHSETIEFWVLADYAKSDKYGDWSWTVYYEGDCKLFRARILSDSFHPEPMGQGFPTSSSSEPDEKWTHISTNSPSGDALKSVCAYTK